MEMPPDLKEGVKQAMQRKSKDDPSHGKMTTASKPPTKESTKGKENTGRMHTGGTKESDKGKANAGRMHKGSYS